MSWTIIIEDENGNPEKPLMTKFTLPDNEIIFNNSFRLLKYLDPYGDTTFNNLMFDDLIIDLMNLKKLLPSDISQVDILIEHINDCKTIVHTYLKFYGD